MAEVTLYNLIQRYDFASRALLSVKTNDEKRRILLERKKEEAQENIIQMLIKNKDNMSLNLIS